MPGGPYLSLNVEWFLSYALLRGIQSIRLCRNAKPNETCIGLLFEYQNQSCQVVGQWRWDYNIDQLQLTDGKSMFVYSQNDHTQSQTLAVEIHLSALSGNDNT